MPRTVRSRSAVGATIAALFPPSSRISPTEPSGDDRSDGAAHPRRPGRRDDGDVGVGGEGGADVGSALQHLVETVGSTDLSGGTLEQGIAGQRRERRLVGRLPQHRVAGDERQGGVPRPHRDWEVERGDHGARTHRVPRLHQAVTGSLAGDGQSVQLARQADGEVADVDHLLDLAEALRADLAGLDRHQLAELGLVLAQQLAEAPNEGAACRAPGSSATRRTLRRRSRRRRRRRRGEPAAPSDPPVIGVRAASSPSRSPTPRRTEESPRRGRRRGVWSGSTVIGATPHESDATASAMIDTAVSACSTVTTSGGARRTLRSPHVSVSRPRRKHASCSASAAS